MVKQLAHDRRAGELFMVRYLCEQTGITEKQARELIRQLGLDQSSLLREARILAAEDARARGDG